MAFVDLIKMMGKETHWASAGQAITLTLQVHVIDKHAADVGSRVAPRPARF